jgi:CCR4-NOT transcription complex subunit 4
MYVSVHILFPQICVWCWHHIMEMAEKEETEGRCPACRTPYDKDRIVKMAANCERFFFFSFLSREMITQKLYLDH